MTKRERERRGSRGGGEVNEHTAPTTRRQMSERQTADVRTYTNNNNKKKRSEVRKSTPGKVIESEKAHPITLSWLPGSTYTEEKIA